MHERISSGTLDSPSWNLVRTAKLAARIYAPLGTRMALGDYVRVTKTFLEAFKASEGHLENTATSDEDKKREDNEVVQLCQDLKAGISPHSGNPSSLIWSVDISRPAVTMGYQG